MNLQIGIIGGGAIGLLISSYLSEHHQVTLYVNRQEQVNLIESEEIHRYENGSFAGKNRIQVKQVEELVTADCLFVCVKQAGIQDVIAILNGLTRPSPVIFTQNGMGHHLYLEELAHPTYLGIIEHGAVRMSDNQVNHLGNGQIKLASATGNNAEANLLVQKLTQATFPFTYVEDAVQLAKEKLIVNAVINPLTALFDVDNGEILQNPSIHRLAEKLCREAAEVLELPFKESWEAVQKIARVTGKNTSSMRADIIHRRKTENEAISGYLLQITNRVIPYTDFVYEAIRALEMR